MLVDPPGSALYHYVKDGELKTDGGSSITEGIGTGRVTANLEGAPIDDALRISDAETVSFVYRLLREEGLLLGSTAGINVAAAVRIARELGPGHTIVTVLCDGGAKYQSRLFNKAWIEERGFGDALSRRSRRGAAGAIGRLSETVAAASPPNQASSACRAATSPTTRSAGDSMPCDRAEATMLASVPSTTRCVGQRALGDERRRTIGRRAVLCEPCHDAFEARESHVEHHRGPIRCERPPVRLAAVLAGMAGHQAVRSARGPDA